MKEYFATFATKKFMRTVFNELLLSSVALDFLVVALGRDTPVPFAI